MENNLKQKTISGLTWSFFDGFAFHGLNFVIGIILARILSPKEFGLIGMLTIFVAISNSIIIGRLNTALIRKSDCTQKDYSTVFFFNIIAGVIFYFVLFIQPAFYDDILEITTSIKNLPSVRIEFIYEIRNQKGKLITTAETTLVFINKKTGKPMKCPEYFLKKLKQKL